MNNNDLAEQDYQKLQAMDPDLATELRYVIDNGKEKEPEQFLGFQRR